MFFGSGVGMDANGYRMAEALYRAIGTPARFSPLTIDGTAKVLVTDLVGGFPGLNPHVDFEGARLVVYVGVNPVVSHGHTSALPDPVTALRTLRTHADVWVLDPRRTETARLATRHLAPRPGTDYAVLALPRPRAAARRRRSRGARARDRRQRRTRGRGRRRSRSSTRHASPTSPKRT